MWMLLLLAGCWPWLNAFHSISLKNCYYNSWTTPELLKRWWWWYYYWCCSKPCWEHAVCLLYRGFSLITTVEMNVYGPISDPTNVVSRWDQGCQSQTHIPLGFTGSALQSQFPTSSILLLVWLTLPVAAPGEESPQNSSHPATDRSWYKMLWLSHSSIGMTQSLTWYTGSPWILSGQNCNPSHWEFALQHMFSWLSLTFFCLFYFLTSVFSISRTTSQINSLHLKFCFLDLFCNLVKPDSRLPKVFSESYENMVFLFYLPIIPVCLF